MTLQGEIKSITESFWTNPETNEVVKTINVLVAEQKEQYPNSIVANIFGTDKAEQFQKYNKVGDVGELTFNSRTKESNGRLFNQVSIWRFDKKVIAPTPEQTLEAEGDLPF